MIVPQEREEKMFEPQRAQRAQREECWEGFGLSSSPSHQLQCPLFKRRNPPPHPLLTNPLIPLLSAPSAPSAVKSS